MTRAETLLAVLALGVVVGMLVGTALPRHAPACVEIRRGAFL